MLREITLSRPYIRKASCWCGTSGFRTMACAHSHVRRCSRNPKVTAGSSKAMKRHPVYGYWLEASSVFRTLLKACCPTAVIRPVVTRRVEPINRMVKARPLPHVRKKINKRTIPSFADGYSFGSVFLVIFALSVSASSFHAKPNAVCRRWLPCFMSVSHKVTYTLGDRNCKGFV